MSAEHDDLTVTYPVRDLLAKIQTDVAAGFAKLEGSLQEATRHLERRVEDLNSRVSVLEIVMAKERAHDEGQQQAVSARHDHSMRLYTAISTLALIASVLVTYVLAHR